jgi:hypothetical protein
MRLPRYVRSESNHLSPKSLQLLSASATDYQRLLSPPPPTAQNTAIPPVPPVPHHLAFQPFPMRYRAPSYPGIIRPNQEPFAFEANIRSVAPDPPPPTAAPPSHHLPAMSLGGSLISLNRQISAQEHARHQEDQRRRQRALDQSIGRRFSNLYRAAVRRASIGRFVAQMDEQEMFAEIFASGSEGDFATAHSEFPYAPREKPEYLPSFTHMGKPAPGFTFDFGPSSAAASLEAAGSSIINVDEVPVASTSALKVEDASTLLVCARCLDPLVLGGGDGGQMRLWGLRCGHLIDGKCIGKIMKPVPAWLIHDKENGKSTEGSPAPGTGKGKQREVASDEASRAMDSADSAPEPEPELELAEANSIRSRLRPRYFSSLNNTPPAAGPSSMARRGARLHGHRPEHARAGGYRGGVGKGKGKVREARVEERYEWVCPVAGCGRVHVSLLVGGQWVQDGERGAVGVYA